MDIKVEVLRKRKCHSSLDWSELRDCWVMSFGDLNKPDTDVEVEFDSCQLEEHRKMVNKLYIKGKRSFNRTIHSGSC